jgi:LmbE family N-acetylglucosaminyl deacetylase
MLYSTTDDGLRSCSRIPDDESLGIGGTLAKYASEGADVFLLTATRGDRGRYRDYDLAISASLARPRWRRFVSASCARLRRR